MSKSIEGSTYQPIRVYPLTRQCICLPTYPSVYLSTHLSVSWSVCLSSHLCICRPMYRSTCLLVYLNVCLSVCVTLRIPEYSHWSRRQCYDCIYIYICKYVYVYKCIYIYIYKLYIPIARRMSPVLMLPDSCATDPGCTPLWPYVCAHV